MSIILLSKSDEEYLRKCATQLNFAYGIIIGQKAESCKYIVVHLAKNGEEEMDFPILNERNGPISHGPQKIDDIDLQALSNQWLSAHKMIPGSFSILGIFITDVRKEHGDEPDELRTAKRLFYDMHNLINQPHHFKDTDYENTEYIFLTYSSTSRKANCKIYSYVTNGGSFSPMDCRFVEKPFEWHVFESSYELDEIFPITDAGSEKINIEAQFHRTLETVRKQLATSEIFIQNENVKNNQMLADYVKEKRQASVKSQGDEMGYKATIYLPVKCQDSRAVNTVQIKEFNGTIRLNGLISSKVWCNPDTTLGDVKRFIREDIARSLMARIQVYCDGLTEPNVTTNAIFISEPPRRVYFNLNPSNAESSTANIQFSEYIFRGETPKVAAAQAKQILDLDISTANIVGDLESLPEDDSFSENSFDMETTKQQLFKLADETATRRDLTRTMYMLGIMMALLVLIISIIMHYFF